VVVVALPLVVVVALGDTARLLHFQLLPALELV
jgi:hypothetical protein